MLEQRRHLKANWNLSYDYKRLLSSVSIPSIDTIESKLKLSAKVVYRSEIIVIELSVKQINVSHVCSDLGVLVAVAFKVIHSHGLGSTANECEIVKFVLFWTCGLNVYIVFGSGGWDSIILIRNCHTVDSTLFSIIQRRNMLKCINAVWIFFWDSFWSFINVICAFFIA